MWTPCVLLHLTGENSECPGELGSRAIFQQPTSDDTSPLFVLNKPIDSSGFTLLHVVSAVAQQAAVRLLMDARADAACRDKKGQPAYIVAPDRRHKECVPDIHG